MGVIQCYSHYSQVQVMLETCSANARKAYSISPLKVSAVVCGGKDRREALRIGEVQRLRCGLGEPMQSKRV